MASLGIAVVYCQIKCKSKGINLEYSCFEKNALN